MVEEVVHSIHNYFLKHNLVKKDPGTIFDELFLETVMRNGGRISELTLGMAASKAGMVTLGIKDLISIGAAMLKGKLVGDVLKPNRVKNWDKIKEVLEEAMKEEVVPE